MSFVTPYDSQESSRFVPELRSRFHGLILFDLVQNILIQTVLRTGIRIGQPGQPRESKNLIVIFFKLPQICPLFSPSPQVIDLYGGVVDGFRCQTGTAKINDTVKNSNQVCARTRTFHPTNNQRRRSNQLSHELAST